MITISGMTAEQGQSGTPTPLSGVAVTAYDKSDAVIGTATSGSGGAYSITLATHGQPIDGYFKATTSGHTDTYVYPPAPMAADFTTANFGMVSSSNFGALLQIEGASTSKGVIVMVVLDAAGTTTVQGATVSTNPASGKYAYMDNNNQPFSNTATNTDGLAFVFNVPTNVDVAVTASKSGMTFGSHTLKARPNTLTTTLVTAQ